MIIRIVKLTFKPEAVETFKQYFPTVMHTIRSSEGCNLLQAWHEINDETIFFTYSIWNSEDDLNNYRHSDFFALFWKTVKPWFADKAQAWSFDKILDLP